jgi:phenylalanyl-tRNA synthetase alpha chain
MELSMSSPNSTPNDAELLEEQVKEFVEGQIAKAQFAIDKDEIPQSGFMSAFVWDDEEFWPKLNRHFSYERSGFNGDHAQALNDIEALQVALLGKNGYLTQKLKSLKIIDEKYKKHFSQLWNHYRAEVEHKLGVAKIRNSTEQLEIQLANDRVDVTLPVASAMRGSLHPVHQVMDELTEIFADLGFAVAEGPEIESDWHNFTALNIPPEHPARAMHDTFYFNETDQQGNRMLLRTHTSPVQIRTMMTQKPPIRIIAPGKTFRCDSDATHTPMFHQVEGLVIDKDITLGHLRWTLETFIKAFFEVDHIVTRFRPSYFPFTEPSAELDVQCSWEGGTLKVGEGDSWLEILGSGMVNPRVIANCGLDPNEYQGFAFGCGIDRLAMLKYGMTDLRAFFDADLRWLRHYGFSFLDTPTLSGGVGA